MNEPSSQILHLPRQQRAFAPLSFVELLVPKHHTPRSQPPIHIKAALERDDALSVITKVTYHLFELIFSPIQNVHSGQWRPCFFPGLLPLTQSVSATHPPSTQKLHTTRKVSCFRRFVAARKKRKYEIFLFDRNSEISISCVYFLRLSFVFV